MGAHVTLKPLARAPWRQPSRSCPEGAASHAGARGAAGTQARPRCPALPSGGAAGPAESGQRGWSEHFLIDRNLTPKPRKLCSRDCCLLRGHCVAALPCTPCPWPGVRHNHVLRVRLGAGAITHPFIKWQLKQGKAPPGSRAWCSRQRPWKEGERFGCSRQQGRMPAPTSFWLRAAGKTECGIQGAAPPKCTARIPGAPLQDPFRLVAAAAGAAEPQRRATCRAAAARAGKVCGATFSPHLPPLPLAPLLGSHPAVPGPSPALPAEHHGAEHHPRSTEHHPQAGSCSSTKGARGEAREVGQEQAGIWVAPCTTGALSSRPPLHHVYTLRAKGA